MTAYLSKCKGWIPWMSSKEFHRLTFAELSSFIVGFPPLLWASSHIYVVCELPYCFMTSHFPHRAPFISIHPTYYYCSHWKLSFLMTCLKDSLSNEPSLICSEIELTIVSFVASQHPELWFLPFQSLYSSQEQSIKQFECNVIGILTGKTKVP